MKKGETKSPIKDLPVRLPGQSGMEELDNLIVDKVLPWSIAAFLALILAVTVT